MWRKLNIKWIFLFLLVGAVYRGPIIVQRAQNRTRTTQAKNYLNEKYPGIKFRVNVTEAYTKDPFEIKFLVSQKMEGDFYDDYKEQLVKYIAEQSGIPCEVKTYGVSRFDSGSRVIVYYPDYESIDSMAARYVQLVQECRKYEVLRASAPRLTISPGNADEPYFPGYSLRISESSQTDEEAPLPDLASHLKENHIYVRYNFSIPDEEGIPETDIRRYQESMLGTVLESPKGEQELLPLVNMRGSGSLGLGGPCIDFGGAYQILESQGAEIKVKKNEFSASINGTTIVFLCEYKPAGPRYQWYYSEEEGPGSFDYDNIDIEMIENIINKTIKREERIYE